MLPKPLPNTQASFGRAGVELVGNALDVPHDSRVGVIACVPIVRAEFEVAALCVAATLEGYGSAAERFRSIGSAQPIAMRWHKKESSEIPYVFTEEAVFFSWNVDC